MTQWLPHDGGPCPVAPDTMVEIRNPDYPLTIGTARAAFAPWQHGFEYRIITPAPDPRDAEIARLTAEVERLRALDDAVRAYKAASDAEMILPTDRGGHSGPKGKAIAETLRCKCLMFLALRKETP